MRGQDPKPLYRTGLPGGSMAFRRLTGAVLVLVVVSIGWWAGHRDASPTNPASGPAPAAPTVPPSAGHPLPTRRSAASAPDLVWSSLSGLELPVSRAAGPRCLSDGRAGCFTHDDRGAAVAAVHLMVRTFPFAGVAVFGPTIDEQVIGEHRSELARLTRTAYDEAAPAAGVRGGAAIPVSGGNAVAGYQLDGAASDSDARTVRVLIRERQDGGAIAFTEFTVHLNWVGGDWRLVAPSWGDWRQAARTVTSPDPARYHPYDTGAGAS